MVPAPDDPWGSHEQNRVLQGTYLGIYISNSCGFWHHSASLNCKFCTTGLNVGVNEVAFKDVFPSGFLPQSAGNIRRQSLAEIYRHAPLFVALRDSSNLKGKRGVCEFREICGGSRARAFALTGDSFAEEPRCAYQPESLSANLV